MAFPNPVERSTPQWGPRRRPARCGQLAAILDHSADFRCGLEPRLLPAPGGSARRTRRLSCDSHATEGEPPVLTTDHFVEFAGMPKSGKTTVLDIVSHHLRRSGILLNEFHGGGRYAPIDKSSLPALNMYLGGEAVAFILTRAHREKAVNRLFLLDRGIVDRCIFTRALAALGKLDSA